MTKRRALIGILVLLAIPVSALALARKTRVMFPQIVPGVHCYSGRVCTDDPNKVKAAGDMYSSAISKAADKVGPFHSIPRIVFCSTRECNDAFGLGGRGAQTIGTLGIAVSPRAWKECYITHELIHHRQAEEMGWVAVVVKPHWLIEGMAYSLSEDPRRPLIEPLETWRSTFEAWNKSIPKGDLWRESRSAR